MAEISKPLTGYQEILDKADNPKILSYESNGLGGGTKLLPILSADLNAVKGIDSSGTENGRIHIYIKNDSDGFHMGMILDKKPDGRDFDMVRLVEGEDSRTPRQVLSPNGKRIGTDGERFRTVEFTEDEILGADIWQSGPNGEKTGIMKVPKAATSNTPDIMAIVAMGLPDPSK